MLKDLRHDALELRDIEKKAPRNIRYFDDGTSRSFCIKGGGEFEDTALRVEELYRDGKPRDELLARIRLLPLLAKMVEIEERTENIKAQRGLIDARVGQAVLTQYLMYQKIRKMELENERNGRQ